MKDMYINLFSVLRLQCIAFMASQPASQTLHHLCEALNSLATVFPYEPALTYIDFSNLASILRLL
jgi:predicted DNA-binding ribbon-helix-helix protein